MIDQTHKVIRCIGLMARQFEATLHAYNFNLCTQCVGVTISRDEILRFMFVLGYEMCADLRPDELDKLANVQMVPAGENSVVFYWPMLVNEYVKGIIVVDDE